MDPTSYSHQEFRLLCVSTHCAHFVSGGFTHPSVSSENLLSSLILYLTPFHSASQYHDFHFCKISPYGETAPEPHPKFILSSWFHHHNYIAFITSRGVSFTPLPEKIFNTCIPKLHLHYKTIPFSITPWFYFTHSSTLYIPGSRSALLGIVEFLIFP